MNYVERFYFIFLLQRCVGKQRCAVAIANTNFGQDPCPKVLKRLTVEAVCAPVTFTNGHPVGGGN